MFRRGNESCEKTSLLSRIRGRSPTIGHMLAGAGHELPCVGFLESKSVRDVAVCVFERLSKDVRGSLRGRQLLQQYQDSQLQRLASFRSQARVGTRVDWFRPPGPDVRFSARAC